MSISFTSAQMDTARQLHAKEQLAQAAQELFEAGAHKDHSLEEIAEKLDKVAERVVPLGIARIKWLKTLTLMYLYPDAAPDREELGAILRDAERPQDERMKDAINAAARKIEGRV